MPGNTNIKKPLNQNTIDTISHSETVNKTEIHNINTKKNNTIYTTKNVEKTDLKLSNNLERNPIKITQTAQDIDPITRLANRQCFEKY